MTERRCATKRGSSLATTNTSENLTDWFPNQFSLSSTNSAPPDESRVPDEHVPFVLLGAISAASGLFRRLIERQTEADLGMTGPRVMLLAALCGADSLTMSELAQILDVTPRAITRLVEGLELEGHVARIQDAHDRRVFHVRVVATTRKRVLVALKKHRQYVNEVVGDLPTPALREALVAVYLLSQALRAEVRNDDDRPSRCQQ